MIFRKVEEDRKLLEVMHYGDFRNQNITFPLTIFYLYKDFDNLIDIMPLFFDL